MNKELDQDEIDRILDEDDDYMENYESISDRYCSICGTRMTIQEFEEFEAECENCTWEETQGLIDYDPDFDDTDESV